MKKQATHFTVRRSIPDSLKMKIMIHGQKAILGWVSSGYVHKPWFNEYPYMNWVTGERCFEEGPYTVPLRDKKGTLIGSGFAILDVESREWIFTKDLSLPIKRIYVYPLTEAQFKQALAHHVQQSLTAS